MVNRIVIICIYIEKSRLNWHRLTRGLKNQQGFYDNKLGANYFARRDSLYLYTYNKRLRKCISITSAGRMTKYTELMYDLRYTNCRF